MLEVGRLFWLLLVLLLAGCSTSPAKLRARADALAQPHGFVKTLVPTARFTLTAYHRMGQPGRPVSVYIEGDGRAWLSRRHLSLDPTPLNPVGLRLALLDPAPNVLYIARPCQFTPGGQGRHCPSDYWSVKRFAPEVVAAMNEAIDRLTLRLSPDGIRLVGYSGGGALAALLAATRNDVIDLRTIAGNLDTEAFTRHHQVTPLAGSLNPIEFAAQLAQVPQLHLVGEGDPVVPPGLVAGYLDRLREYDPELACVRVLELPGITHAEGWSQAWTRHVEERLTCRSPQ